MNGVEADFLEKPKAPEGAKYLRERIALARSKGQQVRVSVAAAKALAELLEGGSVGPVR